MDDSKYKKSSKLDLVLVEKLYRQKDSARYIAKQIGSTPWIVREAFKKLGLKARGNQPEVINGKIRCRKCQQVIEQHKFAINRRTGRYAYRLGTCNSCRNKRTYELRSKTIETYIHSRWLGTRKRAEKKKVPFNLLEEDLLNLYKKQDGKCFYTDVDLKWGVGCKNKLADRLSIDKIIPKLGYIKGNVVLTSSRINLIKLNITLEEMRAWMPGWYEKVIRMWRELGFGDRIFNVGDGHEF